MSHTRVERLVLSAILMVASTRCLWSATILGLPNSVANDSGDLPAGSVSDATKVPTYGDSAAGLPSLPPFAYPPAPMSCPPLRELDFAPSSGEPRGVNTGFFQNHVVGSSVADGLAGMHFWMGGKANFVEGASVGEHDGIRSLEQPERE